MLALSAVLAVGVAAGCAGGTSEPATPDDTPATSTAAEVEQPAPSSASPATPSAEAATATVPDVVGMDHQRAQNSLQAAGFYALREVDATGQGRALLWDRNWVVVSQEPAGGTDASVDTTITLSSKKEGE